jgi:hypothetical protein
MCAWIFECGCHSLWAGADALCNVHVAGVPHCPFCSHGITGYTLVMTAVTAPQLGASVWSSWSRTARLVVCLLLFPAMMVAVGALFGSYDGYWATPARP